MGIEQITSENLDQFWGSEEFYKHGLSRLRYTEGVHFLCENGAAWLLDAVCSYQRDSKILNNKMLQEYQLWELVVDLEKKTALLTCKKDSNCLPTISQKIPYTDFPLPRIKLYVEGGCVLLPSEH